jgi:rhodanese-related sulfurtransferase
MRKFVIAIALALGSTTTLVAQQNESVDAIVFEKGIQQPGVQIFDVRTAGEFSSGHLSNALQADFTKKDEFTARVQFLDKKKPVYVYCLSGGRSRGAAKWMRENGFENVVELQGGINAWKQAGKPLEGVADNSPQQTLSDYNKSISVKGYVLTDVGAKWCPPCRQMEPVLEQFFSAHKNVKKVVVDGGKDQDVMKSISAGSLPTFIIYKDGKEVWRKEGVLELKELEQQIKG